MPSSLIVAGSFQVHFYFYLCQMQITFQDTMELFNQHSQMTGLWFQVDRKFLSWQIYTKIWDSHHQYFKLILCLVEGSALYGRCSQSISVISAQLWPGNESWSKNKKGETILVGFFYKLIWNYEHHQNLTAHLDSPDWSLSPPIHPECSVLKQKSYLKVCWMLNC